MLPTPHSLYIHVPFCLQKCLYCDFFSEPVGANNAAFAPYMLALFRDIAAQLERLRPPSIPSVYIGGGTPSLLGAELLSALLDFLAVCITAIALGSFVDELTIEANPESVDLPLLSLFTKRGNFWRRARISVGVQSLDDDVRSAVGRRGSAASVLEKLRLLCAAKKSACGKGGGQFSAFSFSADLISGLPGQTEASLLADIDTLACLGADHISLYDLSLSNASPLWNNAALPGVDAAAALWLAGRDALIRAGYVQYEVSNFARGGAESLHNTRYWEMRGWLGAGCGASGTIIRAAEQGAADRPAYRYTIPPDLRRYVDRKNAEPKHTIEELDRLTLAKDMLLMGFRTARGIDTAYFKALTGYECAEFTVGTMRRWRERGLFAADSCALTREGLLFLNKFLLECFCEIDSGSGTGSRW
jgi:oxygen-independent coproporphyrinogen-3 oxidase